MPTTISDNQRIASSGAWSARAGFATASALYVVTRALSATEFSVWKSTDGTTWTDQDPGNGPTAHSTYSAWLHTNGYLYVAYGNAASANELRVIRFNTATDTWETTPIGGGDITASNDAAKNYRVVVRSDGDIIVGYNSAAATVSYARWEGSSWTIVSVSTAADQLADLVIDSDDRCWFTYINNTGNDNTYRSLDSSNTLGGETDLDATAHTTAKLLSCQSVVYNDGTNNRLALMGRDTGGELDLYSGIVGAATLTTMITFSGVTTSTSPQTTSAGVIAVGTGSAARIHCVWATANTILRDFTNQSAPTHTFQGSDTTVLSSLSDTDPCPQWIQGGDGYGILYQGGTNATIVEWIVSPSFAPPGLAFPFPPRLAARNNPLIRR